MNLRNFKIITILLILISTLVSCKKKSSIRPPGSPPPQVSPIGSWTVSLSEQGRICWVWNGTGSTTTPPQAPTETGLGTWTWSSSTKCYIWSGSGTAPTPSTEKGYNFLPGQVNPEYNSNCYATETNPESDVDLPYFKIPAIGHGSGFPCGRYGEDCGVVWSSTASPQQNDLITDSRFNVRIVAKVPPSYGKADYNGVKCKWEGLAFSKIALTIQLRDPDVPNAFSKKIDISNIPVGGCSKVLVFEKYDLPVTSGPIALDILDLKTNYYCLVYKGKGGAAEVVNCPLQTLSSNDCFELEVQIATDNTLDFPH